MKTKQNKIKVDHHRNGCYGMPFHVAIVETNGKEWPKKCLALMLPKWAERKLGNLPCFVLDIDKLAEGEIDSHFRGDVFADEFYLAIEAAYEKKFGGSPGLLKEER